MPGNRKKKAVPDMCCGTSEPVAKRTRTADQKVATERSDECLGILNEDCWREVLGYVKLKDLVQSEIVCKKWRHIVQRYLQDVRLCLRVKQSKADLVAPPVTRDWHVPLVKCSNLDVYSKHHVAVIEKYGGNIVAADCVDGRTMTALKRNCPDLEDLRVIDPQHLDLKREEHFDKLRQVSFHNVIMFSDNHIEKFISKTLEQLTIVHNLTMTGKCLNTLNLINLRCLTLNHCYKLTIDNLLSAPLAELNRLELQNNSKEKIPNAYRLIEKTTNLEYLSLGSAYTTNVGGLLEAVCGLNRLKHLNVCDNLNVDDVFLETIGQRCSLVSMNVGNCPYVTSTGVAAFCQATGKTLTALNVSGNDNITGDDMALCISLCPKLEFLDLRDCEGVSNARFTATVAASLPWPRRLRLGLSPDYSVTRAGWYPSTYVEKPLKSYKNLIVESNNKNLKWENYNK